MSTIYREPGRVVMMAKAAALIFIGIGLGATIVGAYTTFKTQPTPLYFHCASCHKKPLLNTLTKYKKFHHTPKFKQAALLIELEAAR